MLVAFDSVDPHKFFEGRPAVQNADLSELFYRDTPQTEVNLPLRAEGVFVDGDVVFSAYKRKEDRSGYVLRMYNLSSDPAPIELSGVSSVRKMTLAEVSVGKVQFVDGVYRQEIPAKRIVTLELD
ncbi:hypothetical protein DRQ32_11000 [bacterium]|nr:MAG: hypothetical protein DRQ32_11000 [bacterium]